MKMYYSLLQESSKIAHGKPKFCLLVFAILFSCMLIFHIYCDDSVILNRDIRILPFRKKTSDSKSAAQTKKTDDFLINQKGCRIPAMFTFGPLVNPYLEKSSPIRCDLRTEKTNASSKPLKIWKPALFHDERNTLYVNQEASKHYGAENLNCEYEQFFRATPSKNHNEDYNDGEVTYDGVKIPIDTKKPTVIPENIEFIRVQCYKKNKKKSKKNHLVYEDYYVFAPEKEHVEKACEKNQKSQPTDGINVMVVALDALSRLNFHRQMPMSAQYLKQKMKAIEMLGYNKVGDNTFPNFIPMFAGLSVEELKEKCWKTENDFFDKCSFVWKKFQQYGYRTNFAEDAGNIGVFHYIKKGFRNQPTDYYLRPFNVEAENQIGHSKPGNAYLCIGSKLNIAVLLNYAIKFGEKFRSKKYFGLFWSSSYTHDWFNLSPEGDQAVLNFLQYVDKSNLLNNTVLLFISDHGLRWGTFRETFQGNLEERLPMLWFLFPKWFENKYRKAVRNLRENVHKLTTPFDLYETLNDFVDLSRIEDDIVEFRSRLRSSNKRQASLFLPVLVNRTCSEAGIPKHYCTCHNDVQAISTKDKIVIGAATEVVNHINNLLKNHSECLRLNLQSVESASIERSTMNDESNNNATRNDFETNYIVTVKTSPGDGIFESTVRYKSAQRTFLVIGSVSRVNMYGSQGKCVKDSILRLYCYCVT